MKKFTGPKSLKTLIEAMLTITYGYDQPDELQGNEKFRDWLFYECAPLTNEKGCYDLNLERTDELIFMGCKVKVIDSLEDGIAFFTNSQFPPGSPKGNSMNCEVVFE
jgi:hypothetical protein